MSRPEDGGRPCLDIVVPYFAELERQGNFDVQMMGGIGSAALSHPDLEILVDDKTIYVPKGSLDNVRQYRPEDAGGTLRDLDCLVLSTDPEVMAAREATAHETIADGKDLELSFFPLVSGERLDWQAANRIRSLFSASASLSDRYVTTYGEHDEKRLITKAVFPFAVHTPEETLDTYHLEVGGESTVMPVQHPGAVILNYTHRSISGLRPKDAPKVNKFVENIARVEPEIIDWVVDGPGASQLELSRLVYSMRQLGSKPLNIGGKIEIKPYTMNELLDHQALYDIAGDLRPSQLRLLLTAIRIKSMGLHFVEKQVKVVKYWQTYVEPNFKTLTRNDK